MVQSVRSTNYECLCSKHAIANHSNHNDNQSHRLVGGIKIFQELDYLLVDGITLWRGKCDPEIFIHVQSSSNRKNASKFKRLCCPTFFWYYQIHPNSIFYASDSTCKNMFMVIVGGRWQGHPHHHPQILIILILFRHIHPELMRQKKKNMRSPPPPPAILRVSLPSFCL